MIIQVASQPITIIFGSSQLVERIESPTRGRWEEITNNEMNAKWVYLEVPRKVDTKNNKLNIEKQKRHEMTHPIA